jgi:hypothetical protein
MSYLDFNYICTDLSEHGIGIIKNDDGCYEIFDDVSNSYESWNISYDEIQKELYFVWKERIKQKRYTREAFEFERNLGKHLEQLATSIFNRTWKPGGYYDFKVYHPNRTISAPYYKDRIVEQWHADKFIKPFLESKLRNENVACRKNMGPPAAKKIILDILNEMYEKYGTDFYIFQYDIKGFFDNENHDVIRNLFSGMQLLGFILFMNIIDDWDQKEGYAYESNPQGHYGTPKGNLPSQWSGLAYLNDIDWYIASREDTEGQVRYMDDGIVAFHFKSSCKDCKIKIERMLKDGNMGIVLHPKKTRYFPVKQGFNFCGWHYMLSDDGKIDVSVKTERKKAIKKRMSRCREKYYNGSLNFFDVKQRLNSTYSYLDQGNTKKFKRYLSYRYRFTKDEHLYHKDISYRFKKRKKTTKEENDI